MSYKPIPHHQYDEIDLGGGRQSTSSPLPGHSPIIEDTITYVPEEFSSIDVLQQAESNDQTQPSTHRTTIRRKPLPVSQEPLQPPLRYRRRTIYLLIFYIPLLVIPWALTCVLAIRPLNASSYIDQSGGISAYEILNIWGWVAAIRVLNAINGVAAIPVISALLAQAAVVYSQRRKKKQTLNVRQVFALADRGWADITILWGAFGSNQARTSSPFLWFAAVLIVVGAIQQPIQQLLVAYQQTTVMTCIDLPYTSCDYYHIPIITGYDPEPGDMALLPQNIVVQDVASKISTITDLEVLPRLWPDNPYTDGDPYDSASQPSRRQTLLWYYNIFHSTPNRSFFVTTLENGTTTGVLREHAMRLNSSVTCQRVSRSDFPSDCSGIRPFETSFSRGHLELRVCVPGQYGVHPWTLSRNRQDLEEELFLDLYSTSYYETSAIYGLATNFTLHCKTSTTRGYFELGNYRNNYSYGPLIDKWPNQTDMATNYNDYTAFDLGYRQPTESDPTSIYNGTLPAEFGTLPIDPFGTSELLMSGPLMTSAIALFGNESFLYIAAKSTTETFPPAKAQICQQGRMPFQRLGILDFTDFQNICYDISSHWQQNSMSDEGLARLIYSWAYGFNNTVTAEKALAISMFFANQAMLVRTVDYTSALISGRPIFSSPGLIIIRPFKTIAGTVIISVLILLQLIGIAYTVWYIYKVPIWTAALDALAVARIGASMEASDLPPIGAVYPTDLDKLTKVDALVGVVDPDESTMPLHDPPDHVNAGTTMMTATTTARRSSPFKLVRGGPGIISRKLAPPRLSRREKKALKNRKKQDEVDQGREKSRLPTSIVRHE